jgi:exopolysaccharide production protein ExoY
MEVTDYGSSFSRDVTTLPLWRERDSVREPARIDELAALLGAPVLCLLRSSLPYTLRSSYSRACYECSKRALDVVLALTLILLVLPLLAVVAILVKASGPGPVFFKQRRLTRGGKEFWCYKFRTMVTDAEEQLRRNERLRAEFEERFKVKDDPRVTRIGAFLRKTSIDELPQLFQVLRGEMSLIGPRPIVPTELSRYSIHQGQLLAVRPGLGGLWQACGRSETSYAARVQMDTAYVAHRGFSLDLLLLFLTGVSLVTRRGAC